MMKFTFLVHKPDVLFCPEGHAFHTFTCLSEEELILKINEIFEAYRIFHPEAKLDRDKAWMDIYVGGSVHYSFCETDS